MENEATTLKLYFLLTISLFVKSKLQKLEYMARFLILIWIPLFSFLAFLDFLDSTNCHCELRSFIFQIYLKFEFGLGGF